MKSTEEIHRERTAWPLFDKPVTLAFHRYRMPFGDAPLALTARASEDRPDGFQSIGMTGPITWSFLGDDLSGFSMEELKRLYAGWYISFAAVNASNYSRTRQKEERRVLVARLREAQADFLDVEDYLSFGELVFYAYKVRRGDEAIVIATDEETRMEYKAGSPYLRLPPLYYFLGTLFFEGKL